MKRVFAIALLAVLIITLSACGKEKTDPALKEEDIRAVCELATLECYYNNVAKIEKKAATIFQKDRKMWIEYEGVAKIGIDMSELDVSISGNTITMTIPKAKILSLKPNEETLNNKSYVSSAVMGFLNNQPSAELT